MFNFKNFFHNRIYFIYYLKNKLEFSLTNFIKYNFAKLFKLENLQYYTKYGKVFLDIKNKGVSKVIAYYGIRENEKFDLIKKILNIDSLVIDIGSNIGVYPLFESNLISSNGFLVSIEPDVRNFSTLKKNLSKIKLSKYIFYPFAVSDDGKLHNLNITKETNLNFISLNKSSSVIKTITLKKIINRFKKNYKEIFIRMDIEGYEVVILNYILKNFRHTKKIKILFESHPAHFINYKLNMSKILKKLNKFGFIIKYIVSSGSKNYNKNNSLYSFKIIKKYFSDGWFRCLLECEKNQSKAIKLIIQQPKKIRYVALVKN